MTADMPGLGGKVSGSVVLDAHDGTFRLHGPVVGEGLVVGPLRAAWCQASRATWRW